MTKTQFLAVLFQLFFLSVVSAQWIPKGGVDVFCGGNGAAIEVELSSDGNIKAYADEGFNDGRGVVRISRWENEGWQNMGSEDGIQGQIENQSFGRSISMNSFGNVVAIADGGECGPSSTSTSVYVYQFDGNNWVLRGDPIAGSQSTCNTGINVILSGDGNKLVYSEPTSDPNGRNSGIVRTFEWNGISWEESMNAIIGQNENSRIGELITLSRDGTTLAISDYKNGDSEIVVYEGSGQDWIQKGNSLPGNFFNQALVYSPWNGGEIKLSQNGNLLVVGAPNYAPNNSSLGGEVRVYEWNGFIWGQRGSTISSNQMFSSFGSSVDMNSDGSIISVGVPYTFINAPADLEFDAFVKLYSWNGSTYSQLGNSIISALPNIRFGLSTSLSDSGLNVYISTDYEDNDCNNYSQVYSFEGTVSVDLVSNHNKIVIHPNPFYNQIYFSTNGAKFEFTKINIYNTLGEIVYSKEVLQSDLDDYSLELESLLPGHYFIEVRDADKNSYFKKMIKAK